MQKKWVWILAALLLTLACTVKPAQVNASPVPAADAVSVPAASEQPAATAAPEPTASPEPTAAPTPEHTPEPTPTPTLELTPEPTPSPTPAPTPFTVVWMSDTQMLSREYPEVFNSMRDWILENRESENIQFVIHTGDVVDGISQTMFANASDALVPILTEIPGMVVSGNHDLSKPVDHNLFLGRPYAKLVRVKGQTYGDQDAAYATFHAGGTDFLVFGIGYQVSCIGWIERVIAEHPDHVVIVVMHAVLKDDGRFFAFPKELWKRVMPAYPNFRLMLCGHVAGTQTRVDLFDDDGDGEPERSVTSMLFNLQDDLVDGLGYLRLLRFDPITRSIEVETYSPWFDRYGYVGSAEEDNHFVLLNAW